MNAEYQFKKPPARSLAIPAGKWLKLDEGAPDGRLFPKDVLARAYRSALYRAARENRLQYRDPRGSIMLREEVAGMLKAQRGLMVTAENICITRGSQMGIFMAARILIQPGDAVLVEALTYEPAVAAFKSCGAKIVSVKLDKHGVDVEDIERQCRLNRVRAIFLTPHHQFPTTVALRPDRRLRLLELARQFAFAVIEDDYDHEYHFQSQPLLPMASYAPERIIYVGSLSKLLLPALRIGYVCAPLQVIESIAHEVTVLDSMGNTLTEDAVAELIGTGEVRRHVRKMTQVYAQRRDAFAKALDEELTDMVDFEVPDGGLAFWIRFRKLADLDRIEKNAPDLGLQFAASRSFITRPGATRGLRIGFASLSERDARAALKALRQAAKP
ncbi:MAG: PLP-dependent aminotransferase family protein [Rhodospirillaceae bacterium]|nr:PLP-dependent aminotransferase family protein [Rhodospirillaceae bacterium]